MKVLVDTSAYYASLSHTDANHAVARRLFSGLVRGRHELVTSSLAVAETVALLQRRRGLEVVAHFRGALAASTDVVWVGREMHEEAWDELERINLRDVSLVDCSLAVVGQRRGVGHIFAFDPHFELWGLELLKPEHLTSGDSGA